MTMDPATAELHRRARGFLTLERYAEMLAHVVFFGRDRVRELVPRFGLSMEQWTVIDAAWTHELAEGKRRQQYDQAERFNMTFAKMRQQLVTTQPPMDTLRGF
jgi:hypothetical protein